MRLPALSRLGAAFILVGAVLLGVSFSRFIEALQAREVQQTSQRLEAGTGGEEPEWQAPVCSAATTSLHLIATQAKALRFRCGDDRPELRPQKVEERFPNIYRYTVSGATKTCQTGSEVLLAQQLDGATLTEQTGQPPEASLAKTGNPGTANGAGGGTEGQNEKAPVYVLQYSTEPEQDTHLCYICSTAKEADTPGVVSRKLQDSPPPGDPVDCTVYITVPKKKDDTTASSSTTPTPDSPSGAQAIRAALYTGVGCFLAVVMMRM